MVSKDPVCGMMVDENNSKYTSADVSGKKVYFCSEECKQSFDPNPSKYGY
jgi:YHS domain-containing protein